MTPRELLVQDGYYLFRGVLNSAQVLQLREACLRELSRLALDSSAYVQIPASSFVAEPQLASVPFEPTIVSRLRELLGESYTTIPEFTAMANSFGGWHRDSGSQARAAHLYEKNYLQVACAIYLQDNHVTEGGGLDLKPRSHREILRLGDPGSNVRRVLRRLEADLWRSVKTIESSAGDLVVWQFNVLHRATPRAVVNGPPQSSLKLGIFWGACPDERHAQIYMQHMRTREQNKFYGDLIKVRFPDDYHPQAIDLVRQQNLKVASY
jgi:hypothetical protein